MAMEATSLEEGGSEKLPEGGDEKLPKDTPTGKLIMPCTERVLPFYFSFGFVNRVFPLNSHNVGDIVEKIVDVPEKAVSVVQTTTS